MDKEQNNSLPKTNENWLDDILGASETPKELGPDELAVQAAGLTHPDDLELEKILSENWDAVPDMETADQAPAENILPVAEEPVSVEPAVLEDATVFFTPVEAPQPVAGFAA